jgi:hypothetical protein
VTETAALGAVLPLWSVVPFASLLLAIALVPLLAPRFWEHDRNRALIAALCALPILVYLPLALARTVCTR